VSIFHLLNVDISPLAAIPGVHQAAVADDFGRLITCVGEGGAPSTAILVLAHATLAAAGDLGGRAGCGDCVEIIQRHENGIIYLRGLPQRLLLLIRCQSVDVIPALRVAMQSLLPASETAGVRPATRVLDLSAALHADPAW